MSHTASSYAAALALLFAAGFCELSFNAMAQTLVQVNAPTDMRGRVIGLYNMASLGLRAFWAGLGRPRVQRCTANRLRSCDLGEDAGEP